MTLPRRCPTGIRRPLVGAALCAAAGLAAGARLPALAPAAVLAAAFSALGLAAALHVLSRRISGCAPWATGVVFLSLALAFWANLALRVHPVLPRELANLMDRPREGLEAVGLVAGDPVVRAEPGGADERLEFALRLERIRRLPAWQAARGRVSVRFRARPGGPRPQYGDRWLLAGPMTDWARFPTPRPAVDWMGRRYTMSAEGGDARRLAEGQGAPWLAWLFRARQAAARNLERGLLEHRPDVAGLMKALLLGYRQELDPVQRQVFLTTGTYHIFAISGQHVAILALFVLVVLQAGGIGRSHWVLAAAPLLAAFTIATGLSASAVRGCAMAVMVFLAFWLNRKPDIPSALAAAALLILAADPSQLFQIGFLLSFAVVAGLVVLCPPLLAATRPSLQPDPWRLASEPWAVRAARSLWRGVILLAVSSLAAWLVSAPLIARWFNLVSPVALAANLAAVPASSLVLLAGCLSVLTGSLFPGMGEVFNYAAVPVVSALLAVLGGLARLPGGYWPVAAPPAWSLAVWYASLLAWLPGWGGWRWRAAGPAILAAAALSAAGLQARRFEAEVFNLGGEPVCFVRAPGLGRVLAQAGPSWTGLRLAAQLERRGIARLDAVLLPYPEAEIGRASCRERV